MNEEQLLQQFEDLSTELNLQQRITLSDLRGGLVALGKTLNNNSGGLIDLDFSALFPPEFFPEKLLSNVGLDQLYFKPAQAGTPMALSMQLSWENISWEIIPDLFKLDAFTVRIQYSGGGLASELSAILDLEGYQLLVAIDLPALIMEAKLIKTTPAKDVSPLDLLKKFNVKPLSDPKATEPAAESTPEKKINLSDLLIIANPRAKRVIIQLGIENIPIGSQVMLDLIETQFTYSAGDISGTIWTDFTITPRDDKGQEMPPIFIPLMAQHDGPGEGWQFAGGLAAPGIKLTQLFNGLKQQFGNQQAELPQALRGDDKNWAIAVDYLYVAFDTATKAFEFSISVDFRGFLNEDTPPTGQGANDDINLTLTVAVNPVEADGTTSYAFTFTGQLVFLVEDGAGDPLGMEFDLVFDSEPGSKTLIAAYKQLQGGALNIGKLIQRLAAGHPDLDFSIQLKQAFLIFSKTAAEKKILMGADIGTGMNLSGLPLIGNIIPHAESLKLNLQPYYANQPYTDTELIALQAQVPGDALALPARIDNSGPGMSITLMLGDQPIQLAFPVSLGTVNALPPGGAPAAASSGGTTTGDNSAATSADGTKWFTIQKHFGPLELARVGINYVQPKPATAPAALPPAEGSKAAAPPAEPEFHFMLDGGLSLAGLTLSLDGLSVRVALPQAANPGAVLAALQPEFNLRGLGLDFKKGDLEMAGAFLRSKVAIGKEEVDEYSGMILVSYNTFSLSAIGAVAMFDKDVSIFIYASLNYPIGGPAFFFVTGLAGGFGYNRKLVMPQIEAVPDYPLIKLATEGGSATPAAGQGDNKDFLNGILAKLDQTVPPAPGEYFIGVGIRFSSFEMLDSFILLTISFGNRFAIDAIGISRLVAPTPQPGDDPVAPLAFIELALLVAIHPAEGLVGVRAQLTKSSYLFSSDCHLTGGFAFYTWFEPNANAGDFVLTVGGYHPLFKVPAHYPQVPRLGFNWQVTSEMLIKGEFYFALTATALMAGGHLSATYQSGDIKAWFDVGADFLISWQPYYYDIQFDLELGVDVTLHIFGTHHLSLKLGAAVHVWGPEFSGYASITLAVITFTVKFGDASPQPPPITWQEFNDAFLPKPASICSIKVTQGLVKQLEDNGKTVFVVNPKNMCLQVETVVPINETGAPEAGHLTNKIPYDTGTTAAPFAIGPMGISASDAISSAFTKFRLVEIDEAGNEIAANQSLFKYDPHTKQLPTAMWGKKLTPAANDPMFVKEALCGFTMKPAEPPRPSTTLTVANDDLKFEPMPIADAISFDRTARFAANPNTPELTRKAKKTLWRDLGFDSDAMDLTPQPAWTDILDSTPQRGILQPVS